MASNPLLTFLSPKVNLPRQKLPGGGSKVFGPSPSAQSKRIFPLVDALEKQLAEHATLSTSLEGSQPEKILVLEIAGNVQDLVKALSKVSELKYLGENLLDENFVNESFYEENAKSKRKPTSKKAYLAMSSQTGLKKLYSLWKRYVDFNEIPDGYTPLINAFNQLVDIRFWDTEDRLEATHLLDDWQYRIDDYKSGGGKGSMIPFEVELWFNPDPKLRYSSEQFISKQIKACGGNVRSTFVHVGIHYHAILGEIPIDRVKDVLAHGASFLKLMCCDEVMYFRPTGQCAVPVADAVESEVEQSVIQPPRAINEYPIVALLDGVPQYGHEALVNRVIIDDPDEFELLYESPKERVHGTSMASIIIHGDLNAPSLPLETPLYIRPILAPRSMGSDGVKAEQIPEGYLPVDLIHRAVLRMKLGEGGNPPEAPNVAIINLSVCDPYRLFDSQMSPWARMLDWLSHKFNVLFVVSAGNFPQRLKFEGITGHIFKEMSEVEKEIEVIKLLASRRNFLRMMSPAESINALTVKAAHLDDFNGNVPPQLLDLFQTSGIFSPINPITLGRKSSVKPEVMLPGGRLLYTDYGVTDAVYYPYLKSGVGPGIKTALPSHNPGARNGYGFTAGTSNAAAMATRRLAQLYETIKSLRAFDDKNALGNAPDSVILKALLVHGAEHSDAVTDALKAALKTRENSRTFKSDMDQFLGFGLVDEKRIHACQDDQATLIYTGSIRDEESHMYKLPLPPSLSATTHERRLIVTLAWMTPVDASHPDYRLAQLWVDYPKEVVKADQGDYYQHHMRNGTVYHDVRKGNKAAIFTDGDELAIQVSCHSRIEGMNLEIPYALVVTLDAPGSGLKIYGEVKTRLSLDVSQDATAGSVSVSSALDI